MAMPWWLGIMRRLPSPLYARPCTWCSVTDWAKVAEASAASSNESTARGIIGQSLDGGNHVLLAFLNEFKLHFLVLGEIIEQRLVLHGESHRHAGPVEALYWLVLERRLAGVALDVGHHAGTFVDLALRRLPVIVPLHVAVLHLRRGHRHHSDRQRASDQDRKYMLHCSLSFDEFHMRCQFAPLSVVRYTSRRRVANASARSSFGFCARQVT